jgi:antitoxin component YwqK of YwqJK toxin-antitoxin module
MKCAKTAAIALLLAFGCGCSHKTSKPDDSTIVSIQVIDRNGFAETISTKDRLAKYQDTNFLEAQPYQKVLRVYGKDVQGRSSSKITSYHPNGLIWQYLEVVDGRANGFYKEWHANGQLKMELHIIEGAADISDLAQNSWVFEGKNTIWDEDGHVTAEIFYEKGLLHGTSVYYFPSGQIKRKAPYFRDALHGNEISYNEAGEEIELIPYQEGKREGLARGLWTPGEVMYEEKYEKDNLMEASYFSPEGTLIASIQNGQGLQAQFKDNALASLIEYRKGVPEGKVEIFDKKGALKIVYHQLEGKKHGEEIEYYPKDPDENSLRTKISLHWHEDLLQGPIKTWFPNGKQESQREMYQNKKNGTAFAWYKNGDIMLVEEYEQDILITGSYYKKGDKRPISKIERGKGTATLYDSEGHFLKKISYDKGLPLLENDSSH